MRSTSVTDLNITFTFFSEKQGSIIIEQFSGSNLDQAIEEWYSKSIADPGERLEGDEPAGVTDVKNVWCIAGHDANGIFILTHVVATVSADINERS
jgi:hypothetical protein